MTRGRLEDEDFCYLTTTGRLTGLPREIEIWFALRANTLYMLSGGREKSQWVKNIQLHPAVSVRIGQTSFMGIARILPAGEEDELARSLLVEKYRERDSSDLSEWGRTSLPIGVVLDMGDHTAPS